MSVIHITNQNFREEVVNSDKPVLLDFWASWCGPCSMLSPVIDEHRRGQKRHQSGEGQCR